MKNNQIKGTKFQRFFAGLKIGFHKPMLPSKINAFHNHPLIRIFRVVGGLSVVTVLLNKHVLLFFPLSTIILLLALTHIIYLVIINLIMVIYGITRFFTDELNVRNSPLDSFASLGVKFLYCWKVGCKLGSSGIGLVGASVIVDNVLEGGGNEKVFTPLLGKGLNFFINGTPADDMYANINKDLRNLKTTREKVDQVSSWIEQSESALNSKDFSKQDAKEIKSILEQIKEMEKSKLESQGKNLAETVKQYYDKNK